MSMLIYLIPVALLLGGFALAALLWALRSGRMLMDDTNEDNTPR
jgi:cbb3-type cytochrome oxidase maturation protein